MTVATPSVLDDLQAEAARAAAIVTELQALGFGVINQQEMTDAAERSLPLICGLARAQLMVAECAASACKEGLPAGEALTEAAGLIRAVVNLLERQHFVALVTVGCAPPAPCSTTP